MADDAEHSIWSASNFHRRLPVAEGGCPASFRMEQQFPNISSVYADEGTAAHTLASTYLKDFLANGAKAKPLHAYVGDVIKAGERTFKVTKEMVAYVEEYTDGVLIEGAGCDIYVEEKVNYSRFLDVPKADAWGTADAVILDYAAAKITIKDLKYGFFPVSAEANSQMRLYALGTADEFSHLGDFDTVEMVIHQPRLQGKTESRSIETIDYLKHWAETVAAPAVVDADQPDAEFNPTEENCKFCNAAHACEAKRLAAFGGMTSDKATAADFEDLTALTPAAPKALARAITQPEDLTDAQLLSGFKMTGLMESWIKGVRAELERRAFARGLEGVKIVTGKQGNRAWKDAQAAETALRAVLPEDEVYDRSVISPTTAEKVLKRVNAKGWERMQQHITRAPGKPSVALETDPREAISLKASADEFEDLTVDPEIVDRSRHPFRS